MASLESSAKSRTREVSMSADEKAFHDGLVQLMPALLKKARWLANGNEENAKDLVQESLMKAIKGREKSWTSTNLRVWLFTILKNTHRDFLRGKRRRREVLFEDVEIGIEDVPGHTHDLGDALDLKRRAARVMQEIERLPPQERRALELSVTGHTEKEMAGEMGIGKGSVKQHLFRARATVRQKRPQFEHPARGS